MVDYIIIKLLIIKIQEKVFKNLDILTQEKLKKLKETKKEQKVGSSVKLINKVEHYYIYNEKGLKYWSLVKVLKYLWIVLPMFQVD